MKFQIENIMEIYDSLNVVFHMYKSNDRIQLKMRLDHLEDNQLSLVGDA